MTAHPGPAVAAVLTQLPAAAGATPAVIDVEPAAWVPTVTALARAGATYLDFLTGVDRPTDDAIEVVAHVAEPATWWHVLLRTRCSRAEPRLGSLVGVHVGAAWHERETHEMFGVEFDGHPDPRPLLLPADLGIRPLRKDAVLVARVVRPWPGAADPADAPPGTGRNPSRRRQPPPGVPTDWLRDHVGDR